MRFSVAQAVSPVRLLHSKQPEAIEVFGETTKQLREKLAEAERKADEAERRMRFAKQQHRRSQVMGVAIDPEQFPHYREVPAMLPGAMVELLRMHSSNLDVLTDELRSAVQDDSPSVADLINVSCTCSPCL